MKYSIIHLYLYGRIKKEANGEKVLKIAKINPIIKWTVRLPHKYQQEVLKELVECGFVKRIKRDDYQILDIKKSPLCDSLGDPLW